MTLALIIMWSVLGYIFIGCVTYRIALRITGECPEYAIIEAFAGIFWPAAIPVYALYKLSEIVAKILFKGIDKLLDKIEALPKTLKQSQVRTQQKKRSKGELSLTRNYTGGELSNSEDYK